MSIDRYDEIGVIYTAKRLGLQWAPWMGDWFVSWSPRNDNQNAEGSWGEWVELAIAILKDDLTASVRPDAAEAVRHVTGHLPLDVRAVSIDRLRERFAEELKT